MGRLLGVHPIVPWIFVGNHPMPNHQTMPMPNHGRLWWPDQVFHLYGDLGRLGRKVPHPEQFTWLVGFFGGNDIILPSYIGIIINHEIRIPTVDGRNPAPVHMVNIPLSTGFHTSQAVQDFSHQQDHPINHSGQFMKQILNILTWMLRPCWLGTLTIHHH